MSEYATVPAGRNLAHNPKPATLTYLSVSAGTLSLSTEDSFSGNYAAFISLGASQSFEWKAAADDDADLAAIPPGSTVTISIRARGLALTGGQVTSVRVYYTDATFDESSSSDIIVSGTFVRRGSLVVTSLTKTVRNVSFRTATASGSSMQALLGGFEVRVNDVGTSFIHGDGGDGYAWEGAANNSPSTRAAFVATPIFGAGGQYTPTLTVEKISRQGHVLEDLTDHFLDGSINYDLEADQHKGTCSVVFDEPGLIEVLGDEWLRVSLRVDRPDGSVDEGPLGVFILDPPKEQWNEVGSPGTELEFAL